MYDVRWRNYLITHLIYLRINLACQLSISMITEAIGWIKRIPELSLGIWRNRQRHPWSWADIEICLNDEDIYFGPLRHCFRRDRHQPGRGEIRGKNSVGLQSFSKNLRIIPTFPRICNSVPRLLRSRQRGHLLLRELRVRQGSSHREDRALQDGGTHQSVS